MVKQRQKINAGKLIKQAYQRECLLRNPDFRDELLRFRRKFPVLFDTGGLPSRALGGFLGSLSSLPDIELDVCQPDYIALIPKKLGEHYVEVVILILRWFEPADMHRLYSPSSWFWRREDPDSTLKKYVSVLSIDPSDYQEQRARFKRLYPALPDSVCEPNLGVGAIERPGIVFWHPESS